MRILLIEDDAPLAGALMAFLNARGFVCECAGSLASARALLPAAHWAAVLLDWPSTRTDELPRPASFSPGTHDQVVMTYSLPLRSTVADAACSLAISPAFSSNAADAGMRICCGA